MTNNLLIQIYEQKKSEYGEETYKHITDIFESAKEKHKSEFAENPKGRADHEQSWRSYKGRNFEKLVEYIIVDKVKELGLATINGNILERKLERNLSKDFALLKRKLLICYGEHGCHLPDVDIVIYCPNSLEVKAVISVKVTLRERVAQSAYWKLKLQNQPLTEHIQFYFVTSDSDYTLQKKQNPKKGRAIVEHDMDGSYVFYDVEESDKVKSFDKLIDDLKKLMLKG